MAADWKYGSGWAELDVANPSARAIIASDTTTAATARLLADIYESPEPKVPRGALADRSLTLPDDHRRR
jgi:hypothetical protein